VASPGACERLAVWNWRSSPIHPSSSDVNKDWTCKDKDKNKDQAYKNQDKDKNFTYSYLLQVAAKPTIAIKQQQWTQSESSQHKTHYTK